MSFFFKRLPSRAAFLSFLFIFVSRIYFFRTSLMSNTAQKMKFYCGFGHIYWKNLYGKLHFLCSVTSFVALLFWGHQPSFTCLKSVMQTPEQCVKSIQLPMLFTLNKFRRLFWCFHCWTWTSKSRLCWFF